MGKNYLKNSSSELEFSLYQQSIIFRLTFFDLLTEFFFIYINKNCEVQNSCIQHV